MIDLHNDQEFQVKSLTKVEPGPDGGWAITSDDGWTLCIPAYGVEPKVGDTARFYGRGIGSPVRGVAIAGCPVYYRTPAEEEQRHREWCEKLNEERRATFERDRERLDAQYAELPAEFKARLDGLRRRGGPDWRWNYEAYEMCACVDAVKIARACETPDGVAAFAKLDWKEQLARVPDLFDGHSGNSFGMAVRLAGRYLARPELVALEHGALCPLVGCRDYSCASTEAAEQAE